MGPKLVVAFAVLVLAAGAHAVTGFGFVQLSVPLLALLFDPHTAVVTAVMASGLVASVGWVRGRAQVAREKSVGLPSPAPWASP